MISTRLFNFENVLFQKFQKPKEFSTDLQKHTDLRNLVENQILRIL